MGTVGGDSAKVSTLEHRVVGCYKGGVGSDFGCAVLDENRFYHAGD